MSCTTGDAVAALNYGWNGAHGNPDLVPVTVGPQRGSSSAWLRVFKRRHATTNEPEGEGYDPLGGNVVVALYVKVAPDGKLVVPTAPWKLVLKDEYARYDSSYSAQTYPREVEVPVEQTASGCRIVLDGAKHHTPYYVVEFETR